MYYKSVVVSYMYAEMPQLAADLAPLPSITHLNSAFKVSSSALYVCNNASVSNPNISIHEEWLRTY